MKLQVVEGKVFHVSAVDSIAIYSGLGTFSRMLFSEKIYPTVIEEFRILLPNSLLL